MLAYLLANHSVCFALGLLSCLLTFALTLLGFLHSRLVQKRYRLLPPSQTEI